MKIAIAGSSGLVGTALRNHLTAAGHEIIRLVRRDAANENECSWNPAKRQLDPEALNGTDAVINLAGHNIAAGRWTKQTKERIRNSRLDSTETLVEAINAADRPPDVFLSASAIGYYGDRGDESCVETDDPGDGFLASVCRDWEAMAARADARMVQLRFGVILSRDGGALKRMLLPFKLGLGGPLGSGKQYMSWVTIDDVCHCVDHLLLYEVDGPVNITAPTPVTNREFTKALGQVLHRPTFLPAPAFALRLLLGEMADALLLSSTRAMPKRLERDNFEFLHKDITTALEHVLLHG